MGKVVTFVVLVWLSVVLVFSAWMIAQNGRYTRTSTTDLGMLDTNTGTVYVLDKEKGYVTVFCGPSDYFCGKD